MAKTTSMAAARIHPKSFLSIPSSPDLPHRPTSSKREVFTVWMKSLIMNNKGGCTVFDSEGQLAYRVDNYECKYSTEVCLMDARGKGLITIIKKKFRLFKTWQGYRTTAESSCFTVDEGRRRVPLFRVRRRWRSFNPTIQSKTSSYEVRTWTHDGQRKRYCMESERSNGKSAATSCSKILTEQENINGRGRLVAEVKQKQSWSGVLLGDDVLTFAVEPHFDHSLAIGLLIVHELFNHKL